MLPVRQLAAVQRLEHPGFDLLGQEHVGRHHHVVAGVAGQQLGFQGFVGVEDVVDEFDLAVFLEVHQGLRGDVVEPVVDPQSALFGSFQATGEQGAAEQGGEQALESGHA
ncbi:hypothetical protein D3C78_597750 [compost metagenome]